MMSPSEYLKASGRTDLHEDQREKFADRMTAAGVVDFTHAAIGISTEAGEILDVMKKHLAYGKPIDRVNLAEEVGDVLWYISIILRELGMSFEDVMQMNINKLQHRFPEKFTEENALNRNINTERDQLEADMTIKENADVRKI